MQDALKLFSLSALPMVQHGAIAGVTIFYTLVQRGETPVLLTPPFLKVI